VDVENISELTDGMRFRQFFSGGWHTGTILTKEKYMGRMGGGDMGSDAIYAQFDTLGLCWNSFSEYKTQMILETLPYNPNQGGDTDDDI
jgi:hypothetical protein